MGLPERDRDIELRHESGYLQRGSASSFLSSPSESVAEVLVPGGAVYVVFTGEAAGEVRSAPARRGPSAWRATEASVELLAHLHRLTSHYHGELPVHALSLLQPYAWSIFAVGKDIENRRRQDGRRPTLACHRGPLWIHASKRVSSNYYAEASAVITETLAKRNQRLLGSRLSHPLSDSTPSAPVPAPDGLTYGAILGRVVVVGHVDPEGRGWRDPGETDPLPVRSYRWHFPGFYGLVLQNPVRLPRPIAARGSQGLWKPSEETIERCRKQL